MDTYITRQIPVTAVQWDGSNATEVAELLGIGPADERFTIAVRMAAQDGRLRAQHQGMPVAAERGDWYVLSLDGKITVMSADLFEASYQRQSGPGERKS